jgi:hypothetical protein
VREDRLAVPTPENAFPCSGEPGPIGVYAGRRRAYTRNARRPATGAERRPRQEFDSRYATLGFNDKANLDEGAMWPTSFALKELTAAEEARIGALVKGAVS